MKIGIGESCDGRANRPSLASYCGDTGSRREMVSGICE